MQKSFILHLGFFRRNDPSAGAQMAVNASDGSERLAGHRWMMKVGLKVLHGAAAASVCGRVTAELVNTMRSSRALTDTSTHNLYICWNGSLQTHLKHIKYDVMFAVWALIPSLPDRRGGKSREWRQQADSQAAETPEWNQGFIKCKRAAAGADNDESSHRTYVSIIHVNVVKSSSDLSVSQRGVKRLGSSCSSRHNNRVSLQIWEGNLSDGF